MCARQLAVCLVVASVVLLAHSSDAEACSIASDYASEPEVVQAYDAALAPAAPTVVEAYVSHDYEESVGCPGTSCGDIHGLHLTLGAIPQGHLIRITHVDGSQAFVTRGYADENGARNIFLPGYADVDDTIALSIAVIDDAGYPSLEVATDAYSEQDVPGCSSGGRSGGLGMSALLLLALVMGRRRRHVPIIRFRS
jgi:uncharacterized protein (TIGR03382 family)